MSSRLLFRALSVVLIVSTLTAVLVMTAFLHRFFYGVTQIAEPERVFRLASSLGTHGNLGYKDFEEIVEETDVFEAVSATLIVRGQAVYVGDEPLWLDLAWSSGAFGQISGDEHLRAGRLLAASDNEPASAKVAVVNESTWQRIAPGRDFEPGKTIFVKATPFEVVGVVANHYPGFDSMVGVAVWIPARQNPDAWQYTTDDYQEYQVIARLDPERRQIAEQQLDLSLADIDRRLGFSYTADVVSESEFRIRRNPGMHRLFIGLLVVSGFLFTLGIVNQLLLLVSRSVALAGDLKIMLSLGARARHALGRFGRGFAVLIATSLLGVAACSTAILQLYNHIWGAEFGALPLGALLEPLPLLIMLVLVLLLAALHLGFPALLYWSLGKDLSLRDRAAGSRFSSKSVFARGGVGLQIALVTFTTLGSAAFLESLRRDTTVRAGPYDDRIVSVELAFASKEAEYGPRYRSRLDTIGQRLMELGGIESVGTSTTLPLRQGGWARALIEGAPLETNPDWIAFDFVTPGYFETFGLRILEGRDFTPEDAIGWPHRAYIVNEAFVRLRFSDGHALGRRIAPWDGTGYGEIVGVVEGIALDVDGRTLPCIYIPFYQNRFVLHARLSDSALVSGHRRLIEDRIRETDPEAVVVSVNTIDTVWDEAYVAKELGFVILAVLSAAALALSLSGAFGHQSYMMALREREFAIRQALGQERNATFWSETRRGYGLALAGIGLGLALYFGARRFFGAYVFGVDLSAVGMAAALAFLGMAFFVVVALASAAALRARLEILMRE